MTLETRLARLADYASERDYAGYDPYDALNSPLLRTASLGLKWGRIASIQLMKRSPVNLRPFLGIRPGQNPKALGLFLEGYARLYRQDPRGEYAARAAHLVRRLAALRVPSRSGYGWGYNFDWQSRAFFLPKSTPTVVCSSFVAHALLDAAEVFGWPHARQLALPTASFFLRDLNRTHDGDGFCFSYSALDRYAVHNASLLGASVLLRLDSMEPNPEAHEAALAALAYSMTRQREDGAWRYSESDEGGWIDSFHTGFNLESIRRFLAAGCAEQYREGYERGVRFYATNFFLPDGTPKYYSNRTYPIDVHSAAEAISFFSGEGERYNHLAARVLGWTLANLADARGYFYFQKSARRTNRIPYMRWSQAWMFRALTAWSASADRKRGFDRATLTETPKRADNRQAISHS